MSVTTLKMLDGPCTGIHDSGRDSSHIKLGINAKYEYLFL